MKHEVAIGDGLRPARIGHEIGGGKRERISRVGASRLQQISEILQVPVSFLFEGGPSGVVTSGGFSEGTSPAYISDFLATSEGLALTRAFTRITDAKLRRSIVELVEQIAAREEPDKR